MAKLTQMGGLSYTLDKRHIKEEGVAPIMDEKILKA